MIYLWCKIYRRRRNWENWVKNALDDKTDDDDDSHENGTETIDRTGNGKENEVIDEDDEEEIDVGW